VSAPAHGVDQHLADRCTSHGDYLAGLLAAALLDTVALPDRLPTALFTDTDPHTVDAIWRLALAVGFRAGRLAVRPAFTPDHLIHIHHGLATAGYDAMARLAHRSAHAHQPADHDQPPGHPQ
jgi:hypothetical protein